MHEYGYQDAALCCSSSYLLPAIKELVRDLPPGAVVVDLGCGNGSMLAEFRRHGWQLYGLEMSRSGVDQASRAYPDIQFSHADLVGDLSTHPLIGRCDLVISTEVVEHVFLPRLYARNCCSFLKPGGMLIISTPYHGYLKNLALSVCGKMDAHFTALWDFGHIKFWSKRSLTGLIAEAGFVVQRFLGVGRIPFLWKSMLLVAIKR